MEASISHSSTLESKSLFRDGTRNGLKEAAVGNEVKHGPEGTLLEVMWWIIAITKAI